MRVVLTKPNSTSAPTRKKRGRRKEEERERERGLPSWGRRKEEERDPASHCRVWTPSSTCQVPIPIFDESTLTREFIFEGIKS
ncbi:unnamed protein product [Lactuca virosa]|uniref:Uncharacterized protein n=1 Tax=Lactuca virosa TaxID=75947 RepID=A0AAU9NMF8_9ASTR|nr:unnamed protein product [Lactuca virosa]